MDNYFGALLVLALFVAVCALVRWQQGSWLTPPAFFMLFWTGLTSLSVVMAPDFYFSPLALLFILSLLLAFFTGGILVNPHWINTSQTRQNMASADRLNKVFLYYIIPATLSGFAALLLLLRFYEFPLANLSRESLAEISDAMTSERYEGLSLPRPVMICLALAYSGSLAGGFVFVRSQKLLIKAFTFLPFIPVLLFTLIYTARAPFLYQVILYISSVITTNIALKGERPRLFTRKFILIGGSGLAIIFMVFMVTQMTRMEAGFSSGEIGATYEHLRTWFFGNLSGFSFWFDHDLASSTPAWGSYSLGGIFEMLGISTRKVGLYDTYVNISSNDDQTNIYTIFRLMIDDYGILSVHLLFLALGFLSAWFYHGVRAQQWQYLPLLSAIYALQLWSFIASFFTYNTNIMACLVFGCLVLVVLLVQPKTSLL